MQFSEPPKNGKSNAFPVFFYTKVITSTVFIQFVKWEVNKSKAALQLADEHGNANMTYKHEKRSSLKATRIRSGHEIKLTACETPFSPYSGGRISIPRNEVTWLPQKKQKLPQMVPNDQK